jgi:hypothetical protein
MNEVLISCPATGEPMATGIIMSAESLANSKLKNNTTGPCPHCGELHVWDVEDAWIEGEEEAEEEGESAV